MFPEHEKLQEIKNQSQIIGEFLDWLEDRGISLCVYEESDNLCDGFDPSYYRICTNAEKLLAQYFERKK